MSPPKHVNAFTPVQEMMTEDINLELNLSLMLISVKSTDASHLYIFSFRFWDLKFQRIFMCASLAAACQHSSDDKHARQE